MKIEITTDSDSCECETCGTSFATGGQVKVDGNLIIDRPAQADCFGGQNFSQDDLLVLALLKLGHTIEVDRDDYFIACAVEATQ